MACWACEKVADWACYSAKKEKGPMGLWAWFKWSLGLASNPIKKKTKKKDKNTINKYEIIINTTPN